MADSRLSFQELLQIVEVIRSSSQFSEIRLRSGDLEIELRRGGASTGDGEAVESAAVRRSNGGAQRRHGHGGGGEAFAGQTDMSATVPSGSEPPAAPILAPGEIVIAAPMIGTFYRAPEPGAEPFVEVGQRVDADTIICIIEVMKLMNSIAAGRRGVVRAILVGDGQVVEHGQPLIVVAPD